MDPASALCGSIRTAGTPSMVPCGAEVQTSAFPAISDRPLVTHGAALLGRALVTFNLKSDPDLACSVMARHVAREPEMVAAHQGQIAYLDAYYEEEYQGEKARAVMDLHRAVLETDVSARLLWYWNCWEGRFRRGPARHRPGSAGSSRWPAAVQVACLNDPLRVAQRERPRGFPLGPCQRHTPLGRTATDLDKVLDAALRARAICRGFERGVAVAYAQNASLVIWGTEDSNYVGRDLSILQAAGEARNPVLDIRRHGSLVRLDVPDVSVESLREAFRAILRAAIADPSVECWELRQESPDRPLLHVDRTGTHAGLQVAEPL